MPEIVNYLQEKGISFVTSPHCGKIISRKVLFELTVFIVSGTPLFLDTEEHSLSQLFAPNIGSDMPISPLGIYTDSFGPNLE